MQAIKQKIYKALKWSEKYTKTDMIYLAKGGGWLTLGQAVSSISAFLLAIAFANLLPKETYGEYKYILSVISILSIPTLHGMNTAITQAVARGYEGGLIPATKMRIRWGLFGALASLILSAYYYTSGNNVLTISLLISAIFIPLIDTFSIYNAYLQGKKNFKKCTKYNILIQVIVTLILISIIFLTNEILIILLSYFISWTILRFIFFYITICKSKLNNKQDSETLTYGKHISLMGVLGIISAQADKILIFHFLGAAQLAVYTFAIAIPEQIKGVFKNTTSLALPKFANQKINTLKKTLHTKLILFELILISIIILYFFISPILYQLIFPNYTESIKISQIYMLSILSIPLALGYTVLQSHKKIHAQYILNIFGSILNILLIIIFFLIFQNIYGIIFAKIVSSILGGILNILLFYSSK